MSYKGQLNGLFWPFLTPDLYVNATLRKNEPSENGSWVESADPIFNQNRGVCKGQIPIYLTKF